MSADYEVVIDTGWLEVGRFCGKLIAGCSCGDGISVPDKGLGRAKVYTWLTGHQSCGAES